MPALAKAPVRRNPQTRPKFEWDGWDMVRETAPDSTVTNYFCPQGELHSFERDGDMYYVHADALGSVRMVTDDTGSVVSRFDYGAWGEVLPSSTDGVPGAMPYRFVGALGVRWEETVGMHYMRQRWYDAELGRFVGRDPLGIVGSVYLYEYCGNDPTNCSDPTGLRFVVDEKNLTKAQQAQVRAWLESLMKLDHRFVELRDDPREIYIINDPERTGDLPALTDAVIRRRSGVWSADSATVHLNFYVTTHEPTCPEHPEVVLGHELGHAFRFLKNPGQAVTLFMRKDRGPEVGKHTLYEADIIRSFEDPIRRQIHIRTILSQSESDLARRLLHQAVPKLYK